MGLFDVFKSSSGPSTDAVIGVRTFDEDQALIKQRFVDAAQAKQPHALEWQANIAYINGNQYIIRDQDAANLTFLTETDVPEYYVDNLMIGYSETTLGKLIAQMPEWDTIPATDDEKDIKKAKFCNRLLQGYWQKENCGELDALTITGCLATGNHFIEKTWDPLAPPFYEEQGIDMVEDSPTFGQQITRKATRGEIKLISRSALEVFPEPGVKRGEENYCTIAYRESIVTLRNRYPHLRDKIKQTSYTSGIDNFYSISNLKFHTDARIKNTTLVFRYYEKANIDNPQGKLIVYTADNLVLEEGPNPDILGSIPLYHFGQVRDADASQYWYTSLASQLRPIQRAHNRARGSIQENLETCGGSVKWWFGLGCKLESAQPTNLNGECFKGGTEPPRQISPAPLPQQLLMEPEVSIKEFENISGQREVSKAGIPAGIRSGTAVRLLQEQDDSRMMPLESLRSQGWSKVGTAVLRDMRHYYKDDEKRMFIVSGKSKEYEAVTFMQDIVVAEVQVKVLVGSSLSKSPTAISETALDLWDRKVIQDPAKIMKIIGLGSSESLQDEFEIDRECADFENEQMKNNIDVFPEDFENHTMHLYVHFKYMKSREFKELPQQHPVKQLFYMHCNVTQQKAGIPMSAIPQTKPINMTQEQLKRGQLPAAQPTAVPAPQEGANPNVENANVANSSPQVSGQGQPAA